jgi:hypothetical protein
MPHRLHSALVWVLAGLCQLCGVVAAHSDDLADCRQFLKAVDPIGACSRLIASGRFQGAQLGDFYYFRALARSNKGDDDAAIADFSEAIKHIPTRSEAFYLRAGLWMRKGDYPRAFGDYSEALRLNPSFQLALLARADAAEKNGQLLQAYADLSRVLTLGQFEGSQLASEKLQALGGKLTEAQKARVSAIWQEEARANDLRTNTLSVKKRDILGFSVGGDESALRAMVASAKCSLAPDERWPGSSDTPYVAFTCPAGWMQVAVTSFLQPRRVWLVRHKFCNVKAFGAILGDVEQQFGVRGRWDRNAREEMTYPMGAGINLYVSMVPHVTTCAVNGTPATWYMISIISEPLQEQDRIAEGRARQSGPAPKF